MERWTDYALSCKRRGNTKNAPFYRVFSCLRGKIPARYTCIVDSGGNSPRAACLVWRGIQEGYTYETHDLHGKRQAAHIPDSARTHGTRRTRCADRHAAQGRQAGTAGANTDGNGGGVIRGACGGKGGIPFTDKRNGKRGKRFAHGTRGNGRGGGRMVSHGGHGGRGNAGAARIRRTCKRFERRGVGNVRQCIRGNTCTARARGGGAIHGGAIQGGNIRLQCRPVRGKGATHSHGGKRGGMAQRRTDRRGASADGMGRLHIRRVRVFTHGTRRHCGGVRFTEGGAVYRVPLARVNTRPDRGKIRGICAHGRQDCGKRPRGV